MSRYKRRTIVVPADPSAPPAEDPGAEKASALIARARQMPLPHDEVIVRLAQLLQRDFNYQDYRRREGLYTAYDELLEQSMEAVASALFYLQEQAAALQPPTA